MIHDPKMYGGRLTVGNIVGSRETAAPVALCVAPDGELLVGANGDVLQDLRRVGACITIGIEIGQRVAPGTSKTSQQGFETSKKLMTYPSQTPEP